MNEITDDWISEGIPCWRDDLTFEVFVNGYVRTVKRIKDYAYLLVFTDCTHPAQQWICDIGLINGWRIKP